MSKDMLEEEREYVHVSCLIDHLKGIRSNDISKAAESLAMYMGTRGIEAQYGVPACIQYTRGVGNFAQNLAKHQIRSAILFDSEESFNFTTELIEEESLDLFLIEDTLPVSELSFPLCPDGDGWKIVILEDIISAVGGDIELTKLLRSISGAMSERALLIIRVCDMAGKSWNKEFNDTVVTEAFEKKSLRKFDRVITAHGSVNVRHSEVLNSFSNSDLHSCAREAHFRPTRETGLDPSMWCCYEKVS